MHTEFPGALGFLVVKWTMSLDIWIVNAIQVVVKQVSSKTTIYYCYYLNLIGFDESWNSDKAFCSTVLSLFCFLFFSFSRLIKSSSPVHANYSFTWLPTCFRYVKCYAHHYKTRSRPFSAVPSDVFASRSACISLPLLYVRTLVFPSIFNFRKVRHFCEKKYRTSTRLVVFLRKIIHGTKFWTFSRV